MALTPPSPHAPVAPPSCRLVLRQPLAPVNPASNALGPVDAQGGQPRRIGPRQPVTAGSTTDGRASPMTSSGAPRVARTVLATVAGGLLLAGCGWGGGGTHGAAATVPASTAAPSSAGEAAAAPAA